MKNATLTMPFKGLTGKLLISGLIAIAVLAASMGALASDDNSYSVTFLVSDVLTAEHTDPNLVNSWGLAFNPNGAVWIADNGTGLSTLYDGLGNPQSLVVTIPPPKGGTPPSAPTGIVFNSSNTEFKVTQSGTSGASIFIFATEDGTISGWSPGVDPTNAILAVDNSSAGSVYKSLALAGNGFAHFLYATDFHNAKIDVFDTNFKPATLPGTFTDPQIPKGYAPFGIHNINRDLYVTYALQNAQKHDDVAGKGHGFVDVFDANGNLIRRFAVRGVLNSPWGVALAPSAFGNFSNTLLIGNFGNGNINAFDIDSGNFRGPLRTSSGTNLVIDGLWSLAFGNGVDNFPTSSLFFTAGPDGETHGLFGKIESN
jgi:uncharacterized protein (TIGR03118 family)